MNDHSMKESLRKYITPLFPVPTSQIPGGKLDHKIKCLLFDIYGTLFISESGDIGILKNNLEKTKYLSDLLKKYNIHHSVQSLLNTLVKAISIEHRDMKNQGIEYPEVNIDLIWKDILEFEDPGLVRNFAIEFEMLVNPIYPMPDLKKLFLFCKNTHIKMGIISNAQFFTPVLFELFLDAKPQTLGFHPDLIYYSYKFNHAKPSTLLFEMAEKKLRTMNINVNSVLYIGNDMLNDIYPSHRTGFNTALFAGDSRSLRLRKNNIKCKDLSPDIIITDLMQLMDHLD